MGESPSPLGSIQLAATSLYVADLDKSISWYKDKLGLEPMATGADGHRYASFSMGGAIVVLEPLEAALELSEPRAENTTVNLIVDRDPVEVRDDLVRRGVACGPLVSSNFVSFLIRDLDGNRFYVTRPTTEQARESVGELT